MTHRLATKAIRIESNFAGATPGDTDIANQQVYNSIDWSKAEDAINSQLPDGYYAKVDDA